MKKNLHLILALSALAVMLATVSCGKNSGDDSQEDEGISFEIDPNGTYEYSSIEQMAENAFGNAGGQMAELREQFLENARKKEAELAEKYGANGLSLGYISYKYYYKSKDLDGNDIMLSARVGWGRYWLFGWNNLDPDNIYLWEHGTITSNAECPSEDCSYVMSLAVGDNLIIMPDCIGYGSTKEMLHPYMNRDIAVTNSLAALKAGYDVWKKYGSGTMEDDWKLCVVGAGEGAGDALAIHKYFDTHDDMASEWRFDSSFSCAGAYDPAFIVKSWYNQGTAPYPLAIPMTVKSMLASYPRVLKGYSEDDFYSDKYLEIKDVIDAELKKKETRAADLNDKIMELLGTENPMLADILSSEVLDKDSNLYKVFMTCLDKNDLTAGWTPKHKIEIYASEGDEVIPYASAEAVVEAFGDKVSLFGPTESMDHASLCGLWYHMASPGPL